MKIRIFKRRHRLCIEISKKFKVYKSFTFGGCCARYYVSFEDLSKRETKFGSGDEIAVQSGANTSSFENIAFFWPTNNFAFGCTRRLIRPSDINGRDERITRGDIANAHISSALIKVSKSPRAANSGRGNFSEAICQRFILWVIKHRCQESVYRFTWCGGYKYLLMAMEWCETAWFDHQEDMKIW